MKYISEVLLAQLQESIGFLNNYKNEYNSSGEVEQHFVANSFEEIQKGTYNKTKTLLLRELGELNARRALVINQLQNK